MSVLGGILNESRQYYVRLQGEIEQRLLGLPKGSVKKRKINNQIYYYLQYRAGAKVVHKYLGKKSPVLLSKKLKERSDLEKELKKVKQALAMLKKVKRKRKKK